MKKVRSESLTGVGRLEQGFVFGDSGATFKELFSHLESEVHLPLPLPNKSKTLFFFHLSNCKYCPFFRI